MYFPYHHRLRNAILRLGQQQETRLDYAEFDIWCCDLVQQQPVLKIWMPMYNKSINIDVYDLFSHNRTNTIFGRTFLWTFSKSIVAVGSRSFVCAIATTKPRSRWWTADWREESGWWASRHIHLSKLFMGIYYLHVICSWIEARGYGWNALYLDKTSQGSYWKCCLDEWPIVNW